VKAKSHVAAAAISAKTAMAKEANQEHRAKYRRRQRHQRNGEINDALADGISEKAIISPANRRRKNQQRGERRRRNENGGIGGGIGESKRRKNGVSMAWRK
jgi:hypothetical protein